MDLSSSSRIHWKNYQDAAIELVQTLLVDDKKFRAISFLTARMLSCR